MSWARPLLAGRRRWVGTLRRKSSSCSSSCGCVELVAKERPKRGAERDDLRDGEGVGRERGAESARERARVLCEVSWFIKASSDSGRTRDDVEWEEVARGEVASVEGAGGGEEVGVELPLTVLPVRALIAL